MRARWHRSSTWLDPMAVLALLMACAAPAPPGSPAPPPSSPLLSGSRAPATLHMPYAIARMDASRWETFLFGGADPNAAGVAFECQFASGNAERRSLPADGLLARSTATICPARRVRNIGLNDIRPGERGYVLARIENEGERRLELFKAEGRTTYYLVGERPADAPEPRGYLVTSGAWTVVDSFPLRVCTFHGSTGRARTADSARFESQHACNASGVGAAPRSARAWFSCIDGCCVGGDPY